MNTHDNIYNILNKLAGLEPSVSQPPSLLQQLNEGAVHAPLSLKDRLQQKLAETKTMDEDMLSAKQQKIAKLAAPVDKIDANDLKALRAGKQKAKEGNVVTGAMADKTIPVGAPIPGTNLKKTKHLDTMAEGETTQSWMKGPDDPENNVPAYQRKATEPGRQAAQKRADDSNARVGAKVFRSPRPQPMDEDDAYAGLPTMRPTTEAEENEYKTAAHELRKWMRKRGYDTKKEYRSAIKYLHSNLDSKHDDTITDSVINAYETVMKHKNAYKKTLVGEAGLDMNLLKGASGAMQGVNTDPESERNREKKYGYRTDKDDTGNEDDYDEFGNLKKTAKKSSASDGPKTKGRPKKNFGPERTTANAYKHKGTRVTEHINIETYAADTRAEIAAVFETEKIKRAKMQEAGMPMVKGPDGKQVPAFALDGKGPNDLDKQDNDDAPFDADDDKKSVFKKPNNPNRTGADTARALAQKGMPKKVNEGKQALLENSLQAIVRRFGKEVREFASNGDLDNDLYDALYDYYFDDMPYGVKKARDGDPYEWIGDHFQSAIDNGDVEINETKVHDSLSELARLAGLPSAMDNEDSGSMMDSTLQDDESAVKESTCAMTAEGQYCEMHGMADCPGMDEDMYAMNEHSLQEQCGMDMHDEPNESGMSINTSLDTKTGRKTITVTADGDAAEELASMLRMAGMADDHEHSHTPPTMVRLSSELDEYANEPDAVTAPVTAVLASGTDLHKSKNMYKPAAKGDNPMSVREDKLFKLYDAMKSK